MCTWTRSHLLLDLNKVLHMPSPINMNHFQNEPHVLLLYYLHCDLNAAFLAIFKSVIKQPLRPWPTQKARTEMAPQHGSPECKDISSLSVYVHWGQGAATVQCSNWIEDVFFLHLTWMNDKQQDPPLEAHRGWKEPSFKMHPSWKTLELSAIGDMCMISKPYLE